MKKNVVWWPAIVNEEHKDKYGGYENFEYSRKTWEYWCKRNDCLFVLVYSLQFFAVGIVVHSDFHLLLFPFISKVARQGPIG